MPQLKWWWGNLCTWWDALKLNVKPQFLWSSGRIQCEAGKTGFLPRNTPGSSRSSVGNLSKDLKVISFSQDFKPQLFWDSVCHRKTKAYLPLRPRPVLHVYMQTKPFIQKHISICFWKKGARVHMHACAFVCLLPSTWVQALCRNATEVFQSHILIICLTVLTHSSFQSHQRLLHRHQNYLKNYLNLRVLLSKHRFLNFGYPERIWFFRKSEVLPLGWLMSF